MMASFGWIVEHKYGLKLEELRVPLWCLWLKRSGSTSLNYFYFCLYFGMLLPVRAISIGEHRTSTTGTMRMHVVARFSASNIWFRTCWFELRLQEAFHPNPWRSLEKLGWESCRKQASSRCTAQRSSENPKWAFQLPKFWLPAGKRHTPYVQPQITAFLNLFVGSGFFSCKIRSHNLVPAENRRTGPSTF